MKIMCEGDSVFQPVNCPVALSDAQFQKSIQGWIKEIKAGEHTLDSLADMVYERGHPFSVRHLKRLSENIDRQFLGASISREAAR